MRNVSTASANRNKNLTATHRTKRKEGSCNKRSEVAAQTQLVATKPQPNHLVARTAPLPIANPPTSEAMSTKNWAPKIGVLAGPKGSDAHRRNGITPRTGVTLRRRQNGGILALLATGFVEEYPSTHRNIEAVEPPSRWD